MIYLVMIYRASEKRSHPHCAFMNADSALKYAADRNAFINREKIYSDDLYHVVSVPVGP